MSQKIIDPAIDRLPIRASIFGNAAGIVHFKREEIRLRNLVTESGIVIKSVITGDASGARRKLFGRSDSWKKAPVTTNSENQVGWH